MTEFDLPPDPPPTALPETFSPAASRPPPSSSTVLAAPAATRRRGRSLWLLLGLFGFLLLAAGEGYLFRLYHLRPDPAAQLAALQSQLSALQQQQQALTAQVAAAKATAAQPPAAAPAAAVPASPAPPPALADAQLTALQTQLAADHAALAALQSAAIDTGKLNAELGAVQTETSLDHTALTTLQASLADLGKQTARLAVLGRVDAAGAALAAGQPLGSLANAPPALAQYADTPPPNEAALRLAFPAAARAAASASVSGARRGYWAMVKARLENLVTISNGSHVIIGAPAAAMLAQAQTRLDAGDLAGAVGLLGGLSASAQQAMADWLRQARGLVAARAAFAGLATQAAAPQ